MWDEEYTFLDDTYSMSLIKSIKNNKSENAYQKTCQKHKDEGVPHWETIQTYARYLNSQLSIIPAVNLIKNVGLGENSTHSNISIDSVPKKIREAFYGDSTSIEFPLKHPKYVVENKNYENEYMRLTGSCNEFTHFFMKLNGLVLRCIHGDFSSIKKRLSIK